MANLDGLKLAWKLENAKMQEMEEAVNRLWAAHAAAKGPPPSSAQLSALANARRESDARLQALLASTTGSPAPAQGTQASPHPGVPLAADPEITKPAGDDLPRAA
jgi:hypothetical protein